MCTRKCNTISLIVLGATFVAVLIAYIVVLCTCPFYYGPECADSNGYSIWNVSVGDQPVCHPYEWRNAFFDSRGSDVYAYQFRQDALPNISVVTKNVTFYEKSEIKKSDCSYAKMSRKGFYSCELSSPADFYLLNDTGFHAFKDWYFHAKPNFVPNISNSKTATFTFDDDKNTSVYVVIVNENSNTIKATESGWFEKDLYDLENSNYIKKCKWCLFDMVRESPSSYTVLRTVVIPDYVGPKKAVPVVLLSEAYFHPYQIIRIVLFSAALFGLLIAVSILLCCLCKNKNKQDSYDSVP